MEFTLNDCISRINIALNYPSVAYEDIYPFLDQAIHELNTNLRIALPTVTEMRAENTFRIEEHPSFVALADATLGEALEPGKHYGTESSYYMYDSTLGAYPFVVHRNGKDTQYSGIYGFRINPSTFARELYSAIVLAGNAYWEPVSNDVISFNLIDYLPFEWLTLFVIPYVCSKWAVRNGDDSSHFVDEYVQGYQQLQSSYNVPNRVKLSSVAGRKAYKKLVEERLPNLNAIVFTRAIYEDMRVDNGIMPVYGGFYETGGWGV